MGVGRNLVVVLLAFAAIAPSAHAAERFEVVYLSGTQSSDVTQNLANEEAGTTCMRASTENVSFALAAPVVVHVFKRRVEGVKRTVWSVAERPADPFEAVPLPTDASVQRRTTSRGPCPEADCSASAEVPWTFEVTGARLRSFGARVGAQPFATVGLESCPYDGARALGAGTAFPFFDSEELFDRKVKRVTDSVAFGVNGSATDGSTSSRVEITATLKRLRPPA